VLFESAADAYGPATAAIVLTGANDDGCRGLCQVKRRGGYTLVQAKDLAQAADLTSGCPIFEMGGFVEVRPIRAM
jgi:two-component system chemotaxis response regulator CheB